MPVSINDASYSAIARQLRQNKNNYSQGKWVYGGNPYCPPRARAINSFQHAEFVANSTLLHLYDGWRYLGQSFLALTNNSVGACGHLAYYAELRAAMAFLAVNGIVTCNSKNYIIDNHGIARRLPNNQRTHDAVWNLLSDFANSNLNNGSDKIDLGSIISLNGIALRDWVTNFCGTSIHYNVYSEYLTLWGIDLCNYKNDRDQRNNYSYAPNCLLPYSVLNVKDLKTFINEFWNNVTPIGGDGMLHHVDEYILWITLNKIKNNLSWQKTIFKSRIKTMLNSLPLSSSQKSHYENFLLQEKNNLPKFIIRGMKKSTLNAADLYIDIFVRAFFLLRISTAAVCALFKHNTISKRELFFWWNKLGLDNGLWPQNSIPSDFSDLRLDIDEALDVINMNSITDICLFKSAVAPALQTLSKTEYILLWGLAI